MESNETSLHETQCESDLDGRKIFASISIGIATATPGSTTDEILCNADLAMYSAKRSGKGRAEVYQRQIHGITSDPLALQADLKSALTEGQFSLHYQPIVDLVTGTVEGLEALIRWQHPTRGNIPPDQFIPTAEASGLIIAIGRWVLNEACRAAVELIQHRSGRLDMAVNLSPLQLRDPTIVETVRQALNDSGLEPDRLVIEVTEGALLDNSAAVQRLHELKSLGLQIAIDDFGTGYSSVNYLQNLPISTVKIDRSFVSGDTLEPSERTAFLRAIIGLTKSLNLRSVAEGIEETSQLKELKELGCDAGQGFLWSPATPLAQTRHTIDQIETHQAERPLTSTSPSPASS